MQKNNIVEQILPQETQQYIDVFDHIGRSGIANDISMGEILAMRSFRDHYASKFHYYLQEHAQIIEEADPSYTSILGHQQKQQLQKLLQMTSKKYQAMLKICHLYQEKHDEAIVSDFEKLV